MMESFCCDLNNHLCVFEETRHEYEVEHQPIEIIISQVSVRIVIIGGAMLLVILLMDRWLKIVMRVSENHSISLPLHSLSYSIIVLILFMKLFSPLISIINSLCSGSSINVNLNVPHVGT